MNTSFENIILQKLSHNGEYFKKVMPILKSEHFNSIGSQELFKLIQEYYNDYRDIPALTELVAKVRSVSNAEIRKEIIETLQNIATVEEVQNVDFLCAETVKFVKDAMYYQALQLGADGLQNKNEDLKMKAQQIMDARAKVSIDADLGIDFDDIEDMIEYYTERNIGIKTQHKELNKRLGAGFLPGTLSVILAAQGVGKSLLMTDLISGIFTESKNVLLVSLEMADREIMKRVHANAMDLPINSLLDLNKSPAELKALDREVLNRDMILSAYNRLKTSGKCGKLHVKDYPTGSFSPLMLEQLIESYSLEKNITFDLVFVDYIGIMKSDLVSPSAGLYSYVKSIGEEVRAVAKKMEVPIISASQLNRGAVNNIEDADNSNVSDSMGTAMTADFMMFLLQNEEMKEKKEIVCKITKNRFNGRTDTWMMGIDYEHMRFNDLLVQGSADISDITDTLITGGTNINEDFGIVTAEKQQRAESYADEVVNEIRKNDAEIVKTHDEKIAKQAKDPMNENLDDLYKDLGI